MSWFLAYFLQLVYWLVFCVFSSAVLGDFFVQVGFVQGLLDRAIRFLDPMECIFGYYMDIIGLHLLVCFSDKP